MLLRNISDNATVETRGATIGRGASGVERPVARAASTQDNRRDSKNRPGPAGCSAF